MERRNLKLYIRIDGSGRDVAGSSVWRKKMPKTGKWRELQGYECCNPTTTTAEPAVVWDYEGVMTVGENAESTIKGFSDGAGVPVFGTLADFSSYLVFIDLGGEGFGVLVGYIVEEMLYSTEKVEINGVLFENGLPSEGTFFPTETDPFPAVGETCIIKLKKGVESV